MRIWLTAAKRITPTYLLACSQFRPLGTWHLAPFDPLTTTTTTRRPVQLVQLSPASLLTALAATQCTTWPSLSRDFCQRQNVTWQLPLKFLHSIRWIRTATIMHIRWHTFNGPEVLFKSMMMMMMMMMTPNTGQLRKIQSSLTTC